MGAATAVFRASIDIQPTLNAQGQQAGLDLNIGQSVVNFSIPTVERIARNLTLTNITDTKTVDFGSIANALLMIISSNFVVKIQTGYSGGGGNLFLHNQFVALVATSPANGMSSLILTAETAGTIVDVIIAG